jgi:hypothetical protein
MNIIRARWAALDVSDKRAAFVVGTLIGGLYLASLAVWAAAGSPVFLFVMLLQTAIVGVVGGLCALARRLFPEKEKSQ